MKKKFGKQLQLLAGRGDHLDFGLTGEDYLYLAQTVRHTLVVYGDDGGLYSGEFYNALVCELVEFCKAAAHLKRLMVLSGFSFVLGFGGVVAENDLALPLPPRAQEAQPTYRVERVLSRFRADFPISIVRCGTLVGMADALCPVVMLALAYPDLFSKSRSARMLFSSVNDVSGFLLEALSKPHSSKTVHLFNENHNARQLGEKLSRMAVSQVPRSFDLRKAAQRWIREAGYDVKRLTGLQTHAQVENTWTNNMLKEHNFSKWNRSLNWEPLVEYTVEKLTGFR